MNREQIKKEKAETGYYEYTLLKNASVCDNDNPASQLTTITLPVGGIVFTSSCEANYHVKADK